MADPDLKIKGVGGLQKNVFRPFGPRFGRKITGGRAPRAPRAPPLDPPLHGIMIVLFFTTKVSSLISVEGGKPISLSLNEINIPNT